MKPIRIMLADDHPLIREAVGMLLRSVPDFELVGEAANGKECVSRVGQLKPDILILDIAMPEMNGEQVARVLRAQHPELKIVALSGYTDRQFVRALIKAGVSGYVVKSTSGRELVKALRAVASGQSYLSPEVAGAVMSVLNEDQREPGFPPPDVLGRREREVLKLIAEGQRSAQIAVKLGIAVATVEAHRRNILRKLNLHSAADMTRYAVRHALVAP